MYDHVLVCLQITRLGIRLQMKWAVILVIADGYFYLAQEFVWVCID